LDLSAKKGEIVSVRLKATLLAAMAVAVVAVGCGGGGGSTSGSESESSASDSTGGGSSSPAKAAFIKQASAACVGARGGTLKKVAAYQLAHKSEGQSAAVLAKQAVTAALLSTIAAEIAALEAVAPPEGDEAEVDAILTALQSDLKEAKEGKNKAYDEVEDYFAVDSDKKMRAYGLDECVKQGPEEKTG
jgi:hypothetical protein